MSFGKMKECVIIILITHTQQLIYQLDEEPTSNYHYFEKHTHLINQHFSHSRSDKISPRDSGMGTKDNKDKQV